MTLLTPDKLDFARRMLARTKDIEGDVIEVGVYRGGALKVFAQDIAGAKRIFGYDTFEGLPATGPMDRIVMNPHEKGDFADTSMDEVRKYLACANVELVKGYYPQTSNHGLVSFCHLDVDLYRPTFSALAYLRCHMKPGALVVVDDYKWPRCPGVAAAVECMLELDVFNVIAENTYQIVLESNYWK